MLALPLMERLQRMRSPLGPTFSATYVIELLLVWKENPVLLQNQPVFTVQKHQKAMHWGRETRQLAAC